MPQREVYKPPVRGGVLDAPRSVDGRRRFYAPTNLRARTNGARAVPAGFHTLGGGCHRAHRINRGCNRPRRPSAPTPPRQSRNHGASRTPPLTGGRKTTVSASWQTSALTPQTSSHTLGSPERGAVTARSGVTEGLVPASVRRNNVARQPAPGGRVVRCARGTGGAGQPTNGAPGTVRPTTCGKVSA